jgi:hypothetical protein
VQKKIKRDIHWTLCRLIAYQFSAKDFGWSDTSILYRVSTEGHVGRSGRPGHKILAPDMPRDLRKAQLAFNGLNQEEQKVITVKYMPYDIDGRRALDIQRARFVGLAPNDFKNKYHNAVRKMKKVLKSTVHKTSGVP